MGLRIVGLGIGTRGKGRRAVPRRDGIDRREFVTTGGLALLSGVAITIGGCSDGPTDPTPEDGIAADITNRHGHVGVVTHAQLSADRNLVLDIRGSAGHGHSVSLTREDLAAIGAGQRVVKVSSTNVLHKHTVTFNPSSRR